VTRFADQRRTITKRQPLPDWLERKPEDLAPVERATLRRIAPPELHPANLRPAYNRNSRRAGGQYRTQRRAGLRRAIRRAQRQLAPWKPVPEPEAIQ